MHNILSKLIEFNNNLSPLYVLKPSRYNIL